MSFLATLWLPLVVSAVVVFVLSAASHMVLPWRRNEWGRITDHAALQAGQQVRVRGWLVVFEDAPVWFFNYNKAVMAYHPWVHGLKPAAVDMVFQDYVILWVEESSPRANEK